MRRRMMALAIFSFIAPTATPLPAEADLCHAKINKRGEVTGSVCEGGREKTEVPSARAIAPARPVVAGEGGAPPGPPARDVGLRVEFGRTPEGGQCIRLVDFVGPNEANSGPTARAEALWLRARGETPPCPEPVGAPVVASSPAIEAARFWQQMDLPALAPKIAPGMALVGLPAYLETGGAPTVTDGGDTPFGPLSITATRSVTVAWDDGFGSTTGPHAGSGGPHPGGDITWEYGRSGPRDVAVTQTWTATWSVGGASGTFTGRGTTSTLFGFPVEEVQAVRNR